MISSVCFCIFFRNKGTTTKIKEDDNETNWTENENWDTKQINIKQNQAFEINCICIYSLLINM